MKLSPSDNLIITIQTLFIMEVSYAYCMVLPRVNVTDPSHGGYICICRFTSSGTQKYDFNYTIAPPWHLYCSRGSHKDIIGLLQWPHNFFWRWPKYAQSTYRKPVYVYLRAMIWALTEAPQTSFHAGGIWSPTSSGGWQVHCTTAIQGAASTRIIGLMGLPNCRKKTFQFAECECQFFQPNQIRVTWGKSATIFYSCSDPQEVSLIIRAKRFYWNSIQTIITFLTFGVNNLEKKILPHLALFDGDAHHHLTSSGVQRANNYVFGTRLSRSVCWWSRKRVICSLAEWQWQWGNWSAIKMIVDLCSFNRGVE